VTSIETDRLVIRNFRAGDWPDLQEMILRYQASDMAQYDHEWPTSADEIKGVAEWFASGDSYLAVCLRTTGKLIGLISLNPQEQQAAPVFGLGYVFHEDHFGQGYATEGCRAVIDYAFGPLAADSVTSGTAAANHRSCRLLRRLGLRQTGRGTSSFQKTQDGDPIAFASLTFAITRDEWLALDVGETTHD
jgi:RimJ/RimL family protein N-acetyltransferase